jgi:hypothetical protein
MSLKCHRLLTNWKYLWNNFFHLIIIIIKKSKINRNSNLNPYKKLKNKEHLSCNYLILLSLEYWI